MTIEEIQSRIEKIKDFPKAGILFQDITPLLSDAKAFDALVAKLCELVDKNATKLVAIESRGFILASAMAQRLKMGMVLVRKPGKLPRPTYTETYDLEYGTDSLQIHKEDLSRSDKVVIVDDVLATGGTAAATENLIKKTGASVLGCVFLMEIKPLEGRSKLQSTAKVLL